jgi:large subunit ribosomal protein L9
MKVLLIKDVFKLGRAGDVKKVAAGFGRNYLIPQGLAVLATEGALKQSDRIRESAAAERARLNVELSAVAEQLEGVELVFPVRAGETGKLYGSITTAMITDAIYAEKQITVDRKQIDTQPIKSLGVHDITVRVTMDLLPTITVVVHREDEPVETAYEVAELTHEEEEAVGTFADLQAELEAEEAEAKEAEEQEEVGAAPVSEEASGEIIEISEEDVSIPTEPSTGMDEETSSDKDEASEE